MASITAFAQGTAGPADPEELDPYDAVRIECVDVPTLNGTVCLDGLGGATFPLNKRVVIAGLSLSRAETKLRSLYQNELGMSLNSLRLVRTTDPRAPIRFSGELKKSGTLFPSKAKRLSQVLVYAGPTVMSDLDAVRIRSGEQVTTIEVQTDVPGGEWDVELHGGDKIFVPRLASVRQIFVLGAVVKPGAFDFQRGMTAKQAVALAGGIKAPGDASSVEIRRNDKLLGTLDFDFGDAPLKAGDTITVPQIKNAPYVLVVGGALRQGRIYYKEGMTLLQAIRAAGISPKIEKGNVRVVRTQEGRTGSKSYPLRDLLEGRLPDVLLAPGDRIELPEIQP